jgi:hypothetical protein
VKLITAIWSAPRTDQARLIIALTPELDEPENRHSRRLSSGRSHACCGAVRNDCLQFHFPARFSHASRASASVGNSQPRPLSFHEWQPILLSMRPSMLRHGCGYALANAGHHTRALQRGSATRTSSTRCAIPSWRRTGLRTSGDRLGLGRGRSRTACRSKLDRLMTLSTSAVAVYCCSDSRSSLSNRVFSIAMTAWLAKFFRPHFNRRIASTIINELAAAKIASNKKSLCAPQDHNRRQTARRALGDSRSAGDKYDLALFVGEPIERLLDG